MRRISLVKTLLALCAFIVLTIAPPYPSFGEVDQKQQEDTYRNLEVFASILSMLQENYVEEIKAREVIDGAINGLLLSLDPHSAYLNPENYQEFQNDTQGSFTGIGIEIIMRDGIITVISPIEGTPADEAGIKAQDKIIKINGEQTKGKTPLDAVKLLRGPKGSEVTISIFRDGWQDLKDFTLVRDVIPLQSVKSSFIKPGFAYLRVSNFQRNTTREFKDHLEKLRQENALRGLIIDLRNNPGGLLNQAVSVADIFLDEGLIVYTRGRKQEQDLTFEAKKDGNTTDFPLVVLVNEGSASASEIVAGAIQDHQRGVIVGTKTFGKGSVQTIIPLSNGAGLRMTTAHYYTPNGRSIQATGIVPDITVEALEHTPATDEKPRESRSIREEDLNNHFSNQNGDKQKIVNELSEAMQERLQADNQLQAGFDILKSLVLYASYRDGSSLKIE
ncbi:MAG: S41 family peptidase [Deltaproteobacteria bacterium]|nr:S41 family peptidase [Deltaproteobacteria bacterium]